MKASDLIFKAQLSFEKDPKGWTSKTENVADVGQTIKEEKCLRDNSAPSTFIGIPAKDV